MPKRDAAAAERHLEGVNVKKILMRSAMPFGEERNISEILIENLIGNNTGNLIF